MRHFSKFLYGSAFFGGGFRQMAEVSLVFPSAVSHWENCEFPTRWSMKFCLTTDTISLEFSRSSWFPLHYPIISINILTFFYVSIFVQFWFFIKYSMCTVKCTPLSRLYTRAHIYRQNISNTQGGSFVLFLRFRKSCTLTLINTALLRLVLTL